MPAKSPLGERLARLTRPGDLVEVLAEGRVRCVACGHRCVVPPGHDGICRVRFNDAGTLRVPFGYVAALQLDPIEKKPFFHAFPGAKALSFGMLGCDYHCGYCFTGDTIVSTDLGPLSFEELFARCSRFENRPDAELAFPEDRSAVGASGALRSIRGVVRHAYRGDIVRLRPFYLPAVACTPDHRIHATPSPEEPPRPLRAEDLTLRHYLVIPRRVSAVEAEVLDVASTLAQALATYRVPDRLTAHERETIVVASAAGLSSRSVGLLLGKTGSNVRHIRRRLARGNAGPSRTAGAIVDQGTVRFPGEPRPGIPARVRMDGDLGALLGYYCAEGCVGRAAKRPNSRVLDFSFSRLEGPLAERVVELLRQCFGVEASIVERDTTLGVTATKTSLALLFETLAGRRSAEKRVPAALFKAPLDAVRAFIDAYVEGGGHRYARGKVSATTISRSLAHGIAMLALRAGFFPSVFVSEVGDTGFIQGRRVRRAPRQYTVVWYERGVVRRHLRETADHYLVRLRALSREPFEGHVYNMEVAEDHDYLAGFFGVSNCQNWLTSQALRDPNAGTSPQEVEPREIVRMARSRGARVLTSTYNEPLITSEWAVAVFKEAKAAGLVCSYVSNGNATPEVLEYIRPFVSLYKVDLKSFRDRPYRDLGGTLERVTWTIRSLHEQGFWLEIVTLLIPGFNDSAEEVRDLTRFVASVSPDIPWHVTAFHKDYRMTAPSSTTAAGLLRAAEIGAGEGLRFVYAGNLPGAVRNWENTYCPGCRRTLVERVGFRVLRNDIRDGRCPDCGATVPGVWIQ